MFIKGLPGWLSYLNNWELIGILAYSFVFAMLESALLLLFPIFLGTILPARYMLDKFVAWGSMKVILSLGWIVVVQFDNTLISNPPWWISLYLASVGVSYVVIYRSKCIEQMISSFAEHLTTLLYVYIPITILSGVIIILRNILG